MRLATYTLRRLGYLLIALVGVSLIAFVVTRVLPGNPAYLIVGQHADHQTVQAVSERLGLDRPIHEQYWAYLRQLGQGDLGRSWRTGNPVTHDLAARWPATVELAGTAMLLAIVWSVGLGVVSSLRPRSLLDRFANFVSGLGVSVPEFWLGLLVILFFFATLEWAPPPLGRITGAPRPETITGFYVVDAILTGRWDAFRASLSQLVLPASTIAFVIGAPLLRLTRGFMRETLDSQYIRSARALGVSKPSLVLRHSLPNVLLPVTTMMAMLFGYLLGGTVLIEYVFAWPGIGKYAVDSIHASDYAPVMAAVKLSAMSYLLVYLLVDLLHFVIDPRTRL